MAECIVCGATIEKEKSTVIGELIQCEDCSAELEVRNLEPFTLAQAPQVEEDWGE